MPKRDQQPARRAAPGGADHEQRPAARTPSDPGAANAEQGAGAPPRPYNDAGVFTQMYSVTSLLGFATRCGVELAKKIESPGSRK